MYAIVLPFIIVWWPFLAVGGLQLGPMQFPDSQYVWEPSDSTQQTIVAKVTGLKPLQMYRFYVWAYTAAGQGSEYFIDDSTVAADCKLYSCCYLFVRGNRHQIIPHFLYANF